MNAFDTQLDALKFLQGSQLDDALTLVSRRFKSVVEGHRDQLPLRALRVLCVDAKCLRGPKFYEVTIESENLPSRAQT